MPELGSTFVVGPGTARPEVPLAVSRVVEDNRVAPAATARARICQDPAASFIVVRYAPVGVVRALAVVNHVLVPGLRTWMPTRILGFRTDRRPVTGTDVSARGVLLAGTAVSRNPYRAVTDAPRVAVIVTLVGESAAKKVALPTLTGLPVTR